MVERAMAPKVMVRVFARGTRKLLVEHGPFSRGQAVRVIEEIRETARQEHQGVRVEIAKPHVPTASTSKLRVYSGGRWYHVGSVGEASRRVQTTAATMGSTEWYGLGAVGGKNWAGMVIDHNERPVAKISYNGRVWVVDRRGRETGEEIDPRSL